MADDLADFLEEFDRLTNTVGRANHQFFADQLRRWLKFLDSRPESAALIREIEESADFESWAKIGLKDEDGIGAGTITWPDDDGERLGVQLALFRSLSAGEDAALDFASTYVSSISSGTQINDVIADLVDQVFEPFAGDLRRRLQQEGRRVSDIPASDRTVDLDDNSAPYKELVKAIDDLRGAVAAINDYDDYAEKDQRIAEIDAGRRLLEAPRARIEAIASTLGYALKYIAKKFVETAAGKLAALAISKLIALLPAILALF